MSWSDCMADLSDRMVLLKLQCQIVQVLPLVTFGGTTPFMPGHVLNLTDVGFLQPVHNDRRTDVPWIADFRMLLFKPGYKS